MTLSHVNPSDAELSSILFLERTIPDQRKRCNQYVNKTTTMVRRRLYEVLGELSHNELCLRISVEGIPCMRFGEEWLQFVRSRLVESFQ